MKNKKKLFLLDGFALIYRAFFAFAKNPRINSKGVNTSAIFGFTNTLNEVLRKEKPSHIAVVFDRSAPTERHIEYPEYKAHREAMPEGIKDALPYIDKLLEAFNIPKIYKDGFEADDIIGTLAKKAEQHEFEIYMMTSDKDFAQLVSKNIFMYRPGNKWQPTAIWGIPEVLEKFSIERVDQVIDFLGMMGDSADNIPGIPGIGKKTAQKLLKKYGTMEGLFANSHELKGKMKENVESSKEIGLLCKKLATIITDVPIEFEEKALIATEINKKKITELFDELEFKTLLQRTINIQDTSNKKSLKKDSNLLVNQNKKKDPIGQFDLFSEVNTTTNKKLSEKNFKFIADKKEVENVISKIKKKKRFSLEIITDTDNLFNTKIAGFAISFTQKNGYYFHLNEKSKGTIEPLFQDESLKLIGFDLKRVIKIFANHDIILKCKLFDVQIAHYVLNPDMRNSLDIISENYLGILLSEEKSIVGKGTSKTVFSSLESSLITKFACERASAIYNLGEIFQKNMQEIGVYDLFEKIELPLIKVLAKMELEGVSLDINMLKNYSLDLTLELKKITEKIHELAEEEFNIASPKQMGEMLFNKMQLSKKPKKTKSGQYSTSEETLLTLKNTHPIIEHILNFRGIKKLLSTYVNTLPELINEKTKRIHTTFNQSVASTGRLSSVNPNIQNIPIRTEKGMKVRQAFIARNKNFTLLSADYSQIELRIMASLSKDKKMLKAFNQGVDIHSVTASKVYNVPLEAVDKKMRSNAKSVNFGIIYGISAFGLSQNIGVKRTEAKAIIDEYFQQFPKVKEYMDWSIEEARKQEFVKTIMGRRRYLKDINARNAVIRSMAERNAINAPIQGSAADIIKIAMIEIDAEITKRNMQSRMLLQVHDELVFDMHNSERDALKNLVKEKMEKAVKLEVPIIIDIGEGINWLEAH